MSVWRGVTVIEKCSDCAGIRTQDLAVKSRLLYQLSYATMVVKLVEGEGERL